jgi:hypothetical protein
MMLDPEDIAVDEQITDDDLEFHPSRKGAQYAENPFEELINGNDDDHE